MLKKLNLYFILIGLALAFTSFILIFNKFGQSINLTTIKNKIVIAHTKPREKTITLYYSSKQKITEKKDYTEFYDNGWWAGTLDKKDTEYDRENNRYKVTYKGDLSLTETYK